MRHSRWKNILFNIGIGLNCLLLFLLIFESRISLPVWLQVVGRTHPLVLHFPIVLAIMYIVAVWLLPKNETFDNAKDVLLLLSCITAAITALAGLFLSREEGYDAEALQGHKWSGIGLSIFLLIWYSIRRWISNSRIITVLASGAALFLIIFAGHRGSVITHGEGFILAPAKPDKKMPAVSPEEAEVYTNLVKPILQDKCMSCHNSRKAKGELVMETEASLLKGGKSGALWDSTAEDFGHMLQRIHLPLAAKKHMPPEGKPQLTVEEIAVLEQWIRKGADFRLRVADLPADDSLAQLANNILMNAALQEYDFEEADPSVVAKLNTANSTVTPTALNSPALTVNFFNRALFQPDQLKDLLVVKKQVVYLDLTGMAVKDEDLKTIAELQNLRRLNLSNTDITGETFSELKKLKHLRTLSVSGAPIKDGTLLQLKELPQLKTVYAWNIPARDLDKLIEQSKGLRVEKGFRADTVVLKLSPPVADHERFMLSAATPLKLKHYIKGTAIRYTVDGTEPDSIHSPIYNENYVIDDIVQVRAKAFKPGWTSSDVMETWFYRSAHRPDSVVYLSKPDAPYTGDSTGALIDLAKGELNYRLGNWVGFRKNRMECVLPFSSPVTLQSVGLSCLTDIGSYIMPPASIEIWGGDDLRSLKLLSKSRPAQPDTMRSSYMRPYMCGFEKTSVKYLKIIAIPVARLPVWHPGKGDKAWIFVDEILIN